MGPPAEAGSPEEAAQVERLRQAYLSVFQGRGGKEDADIVLVDLAYESGYFFTDDGMASDQQLRHDSGRRFVFGRIARMLQMSNLEIADLQKSIARMQYQLSNPENGDM
jgi:hypothetical protein